MLHDVLATPDALLALAAHDVGTVYRMLTEHGVSQHRIAREVGQSQSEVCDVIQGRKIKQYHTLKKVCDGLGVPREAMGLSHYGPNGVYAGRQEVEPVVSGVAPESGTGEERELMERRQFVGNAAALLFGSPVFGEVVEFVVSPTTTPAYPRAGMPDVARMKTLTTACWQLNDIYGGGSCADLISRELPDSYRLLSAPGMRDKVRLPLFMSVAEVHMVAGWAVADTGDFRKARSMFARALKIVKEAYKDQPRKQPWYHGPEGREVQSLIASILIFQASLYGEMGAAQDMLQLVQLAEFVEPDGLVTSRAAINSAWGHAQAAQLGQLGEAHLVPKAVSEITRAQDLYAKHKTDTPLPPWLVGFNAVGPVAVTESTYRELATRVDDAYLSKAVPASLAAMPPEESASQILLNKSRAAELHFKAGDIKNGLQLAGDVANTADGLWSTSWWVRTA
ncbi:MAG: helix-turn-helix domain-containing protein, partial [Pseudonocardiaceae bacterium]